MLESRNADLTITTLKSYLTRTPTRANALWKQLRALTKPRSGKSKLGWLTFHQLVESDADVVIALRDGKVVATGTLNKVWTPWGKVCYSDCTIENPNFKRARDPIIKEMKRLERLFVEQK
jgi:hypothetical protein